MLRLGNECFSQERKINCEDRGGSGNSIKLYLLLFLGNVERILTIQ